MSAEAARLAIVTQFDAALAAYPPPVPIAQYENRNMVDTTLQQDPFVELDIKNISGRQLDLSNKPMTEQRGQIWITAFAKEGTGSRAAGLILDYFLPWFELKELGIVRTHSAFYFNAKPVNGWQPYPLLVPFWWIRVAA